MAIRRVFEAMEWYDLNIEIDSGLLSGWTAVLISLLMLLSLIFIKRIFNIQKQIETLRKKNESRVLSAILKTEEKERQHFAKELHDGLGPLLSSVKMAISASLYDNTENKTILRKAENLIDESITSLKNISTKLSPHVLIDFGLLKAVRSFIGKLQISSKPIIRFNSNIKDKRFSYNTEVVIYRVICELISNTLKHADAHNIFIDLLEDGKSIHLKYIDDGKGFDIEQEEHKLSGMGYSNMKSRIRSLNGSFEVFSRPGEGVNIDIKISTTNNEKG
jgi:signal transduction histidine kinase